jgi:APA family basic amino acid/polyamine antiporter
MLARRIRLEGAIAIGLGSMIGAGVFSAVAPAAKAAGPWLLAGLVLAGLVALFNATSVSWLAAKYPESGGAYVYGRERLGPIFGFVAGFSFIAGKLASAAAMALTFGAYVDPPRAKLWAIGAIAVLTAINYAGVKKTVAATWVIVGLVLLALAIVVFAALAGGNADLDRLIARTGEPSLRGVLQSAGLLFFAFAGYARIATLGEEVEEPARTIPRATMISLGIVFVIYAVVMTSALLALDPAALAEAPAPLAAAVEAGRRPEAAIAVRAGATVASIGVLLSLIAGISRTMYAMAKNADFPRAFAAVHPRAGVPHRAIVLAGAAAASIAALGGIGSAISFSSFSVLVYYAIANASAFTLRKHVVPALGFAACLAIAFSLDARAVLSGLALLAAAIVVFRAKR